MNVRRIEGKDVDELSRLYMRCFNSPPWNDGWSEEAAKERVTELIEHPQFIGLLGDYEDATIALVLGIRERWTKGYQYHLVELCVEPTMQRKGYGQALMTALHQLLQDKDINQIYLETRANAFSEEFFTELGYKQLQLTSLIHRLK